MLRCICFDWGGTLMSEDGPQDRAMALWPKIEAMPGAQSPALPSSASGWVETSHPEEASRRTC